jgi:hypothetical protein
MGAVGRIPLEFFVQLIAAKINLGDEGVGQGSPHELKAILMKSGFSFNPITHTFANTGIVSLATPSIDTLTELDTGSLPAGEKFYRITAINSVGETLGSSEDSIVVSGPSKRVQLDWTAVNGATGYKIYGRGTGQAQLIDEVGLVETYIDDGTITPGAALDTDGVTGYELETGGGYSSNSKVIDALTVARDIVSQDVYFKTPTVTWTATGTIGPAAGLAIIDTNESSQALQPIVAYLDFVGDITESNPSDFVVNPATIKLRWEP